MSMLPEIAEKFQEAFDDWLTGVKELAQEILGDDADEETVFLQTAYCHATTLIGFNGAYYYPDNIQQDWGKTVYCKCDFYFSDGVSTISSPEYVGKGYNNGNYPTDEEVQLMMGAVNGAMPIINTAAGYTQACLVGQSGGNYVRITGYNGSYNNDAVSLTYGNYAAAHRTDSRTAMVVYVGGVNYTVNNEQIITTTGVSELELQPTSQPIGCIVGIAGYPYIGNMKDITYINDFVNKMVSTGQSTHNYNNTYTTPSGAVIRIYYGDNYTFTYVEDDEPVSYDDIKNAIDIAINQINEDNDTDIHSEPWSPTPPEPPEPVTDDDYIDMGLGVETDGMAMYNMAVLTRDDLIQLIGDFETNADTGLSFLPHVLGLYKLGIESSQLLTTKSDTINLHKEPGKTAFISNDNYSIVDEQLQVIDCGSITVDREELLTNTFLDYSPYSTYEMFIPGCGWITLPDTVVGRTISVHIVFDLTTCSCKGVVRSEGELLGGSGSTLATVNGIIGSSVPLSINETGLQRGAIMNGAVQTVTALGTSAMGIGIGNPYMGMSGIAMAAGSLAETHIAGNATYTSTKGGATDYSVFGDGYKAVLKITRPKLEIPDNYGHTVGYVVNKYDTLGNYSGFTVCLNPHVTGLTCTSDEKDEIARLLERGVILPSGE